MFVLLLQGYCYNSECPLHDEQCQDLWGPGMNFVSQALKPVAPFFVQNVDVCV